MREIEAVIDRAPCTKWFKRLSVIAAVSLMLSSSREIAAQESSHAFSHVQLPAPPENINHGPAIAELAAGEFLACWYSGSSEGGPNSEILCSRSIDGGASWLQPTVAVRPGEKALGADEPNKSVGNVVLYNDRSGRLWMVYGVIQRWQLPLVGNICTNWRCGRVDAKVSEDAGRSWSDSIRLDNQTGALPRGKPIPLPHFTEALPLYIESDHRSFIRFVDFEASTSNLLRISPPYFIPGSGIIEPVLVPIRGGGIRSYLRDSSSEVIRTAVLDIGTGLWTKVTATNLPNPNSAIDAYVDTKGITWMVYNPSTKNRKALSLAASSDGQNFAKKCDLIRENTEGDVAYPYVIQTKQNKILVIFSSFTKTRIDLLSFNINWPDTC
jgi:predicted neuraminidase